MLVRGAGVVVVDGREAVKVAYQSDAAPWTERKIAMPGKTQKSKTANTTVKSGRRSLFRELMSGVEAMRKHREGRLTLRTHEVSPISSSPIDP